jgi:hypothetical protein
VRVVSSGAGSHQLCATCVQAAWRFMGVNAPPGSADHRFMILMLHTCVGDSMPASRSCRGQLVPAAVRLSIAPHQTRQGDRQYLKISNITVSYHLEQELPVNQDRPRARI